MHRMTLRRFLAAGLATATLASVFGVAIAQDAGTPAETLSVEEARAARSPFMRQNGMLLRDASRASGDEAVAAMTSLRDNYLRLPTLFPEGSHGDGSDALPAIWENWDAFVAIAESGAEAAQQAIDAAEAGDAAAYQEAVRAVSGTCAQCHQQFRS
jgi:cytochrome c556